MCCQSSICSSVPGSHGQCAKKACYRWTTPFFLGIQIKDCTKRPRKRSTSCGEFSTVTLAEREYSWYAGICNPCKANTTNHASEPWPVGDSQHVTVDSKITCKDQLHYVTNNNWPLLLKVYLFIYLYTLQTVKAMAGVGVHVKDIYIYTELCEEQRLPWNYYNKSSSFKH